jgi:hypothetical protein
MKRVKLVRPRKKEPILQVKCLIGDEGHVWIGSYDKLPPAVRLRLRESPFNLCAACLVFYVLPEVNRQHPSYTPKGVVRRNRVDGRGSTGGNDTMMTTFSKGRSEQ